MKPLRTRRIGSLQIDEWRFEAGYVHAPHAHLRATVVVQLEGGFEHGVDGESWSVGPGDRVVIPPGRLHEERVGSQGTRSLIVSWAEGEEPELLRTLDRSRVFRGGAGAFVGEVLESELDHADDLTALGVEEVVAELLAELKPPTPEVGGSEMRAVVEALERDLSAVPSLDVLAATHAVSRAGLTRGFRAATGKSIGEFVRMRRVESAATLLRDPDFPIADVALAAGFYDQSHLNRLFKRRTGKTPAEYRATLGQRY